MSRQDWRTPPAVFAALNERFGPFDCDVAADPFNRLCKGWLGEGEGPPVERIAFWGDRNWCNPPFSSCDAFVLAASRASRQGKQTVMLTHSNPNSPWFRDALRYAALYCPDRRINYWHPEEDAKSADRDTVVWHFGGRPGTVQEIHIPEHRLEIRRLTAEAKGQATLDLR